MQGPCGRAVQSVHSGFEYAKQVISRRSLLACAAGATLPAAAGTAPPLVELAAALPIAEKIRRIETFLHERYYDDKGILYSHWNFAEERPLRASDFHPDTRGPLGVALPDWYNYENSPMIAGIFLASQCYRYEATKEPQALEMAARAFGSIDAVFKLAEGKSGDAPMLIQRAGIVDPTDRFEPMPGWISKPYGQSMTMQTSSEQNFGPMWGLYVYRPHAPAATRRRIDYMITSVATLWRQNRYTISFFGENWNLEQSMPRAQRHMPVWMWINRLAFEVSGEAVYQREFERLHALFGAMPTARETNHGMGRRKYISTEDRAFHDKEAVVADFLIDLHPPARDQYIRAMEAWWEFAGLGMRPDLFSHRYIDLDTVTGEWTPLKKSVKPRSQWTSPWIWTNAVYPVCWGEIASRRVLASAIVARRGSRLAKPAREFASLAFAKLDKEHLRYNIDPENSLDPEAAYVTNLLSGDGLAYFPAAYWYGRRHKLWA